MQPMIDVLRGVAEAYPQMRLLLLYGSRARGDNHERSDWDLGYISSGKIDHLALLSELTHRLRTDSVDLVDLDSASGLLRFKAASEGIIIYELEPDTYEDFAISAALYWYDVEPIVRQAHDAVLARLS